MIKLIFSCVLISTILTFDFGNVSGDLQIMSKENTWLYSFINTQKSSWIDAWNSCKKLNAALASVDSSEEFQYLQKVLDSIGPEGASYVRTDSYWISGSDIHEEGKWFWMNNGQPVPNNLWADTQPDNQFGIQHCTCHWPFARWALDDNICNSTFNYICKRAIGNCV